MHEEIKQMSMSVASGTTRNGLECPRCSGGVSGDHSLSLTKDSGLIKWICYRAKCGYRGILGDNPNNFSAGSTEPKPPKRFTRDLVRLPEDVKNFLCGRFPVLANTLVDWAWCPCTNRVVMPVRGYRGYTIGHVARAYPELGSSSGPKAVAYWESNDVPKLHFECLSGGRVALVEDVVSAVAVSAVCDSVALLGTNLSPEQTNHLVDVGVKSVVFMFDADAWGKAAKYAAQYSVLFPEGCTFLTWDSELDPKDMCLDELEEVLSGA